jgi:hypothetical protein
LGYGLVFLSRGAAGTFYNQRAMKRVLIPLILTLLCLTACNKSSGPVALTNGTSSSKPPDAVQKKLQEYAGAAAADCGRLDVKATPDQSKAASDCALGASQSKHPFYVAYDMPGMTIGVAGNAEGKLFTVQTQGSGASAELTGADCPSQLRVASSGRVTCFAPSDMGGMGSGHGGGAMPSGMANPHGGGTTK